jgi:hypothetical protein
VVKKKGNMKEFVAEQVAKYDRKRWKAGVPKEAGGCMKVVGGRCGKTSGFPYVKLPTIRVKGFEISPPTAAKVDRVVCYSFHDPTGNLNGSVEFSHHEGIGTAGNAAVRRLVLKAARAGQVRHHAADGRLPSSVAVATVCTLHCGRRKFSGFAFCTREDWIAGRFSFKRGRSIAFGRALHAMREAKWKKAEKKVRKGGRRGR